MTQKFYFHAAASPNVGSGTLPSGENSTRTPTVSAAGATTQRAMDGNLGTSQASLTFTTAASTSAQFCLFGMFESAPLAAQTISSGSWALSLAGDEANASSNLHFTCCLYVWRPSTGAVVGTIFDTSASTGEPGTSQTAESVTTLSGSSVTAAAGDILVCEVWRDGTTQALATGYANTFFYDGTTEASTTTCASFVKAPADLQILGSGSPFTVTATGGGTVIAQGALLRVRVLTGQAASQAGKTGSSQSAYQVSLTPNATGSWVYAALVDDTAFTKNATSILPDSLAGASGTWLGSARSLAKTTSGTAVSVGASSPSWVDGGVAAAEIEAGTGLAEDPTSPEPASSTTAHAVTSLSFAPPAGSLLVAMVSHLAASTAMTDTSGLGLTWVKLVEITTDGYAGVWIALMPSGGTPVSSADTPGTVSDAGETVRVSSADTLGTVSDAGELVHAALSSADTLGTVVTAGESTHVTSADTLGTAVTAGEHAAATLGSADTLGTAVTAGETVRLSSADALGTVSDAGERAALSSSDVPGTMAETQLVTIPVSSADTPGTAVDAGEHVVASLPSLDTPGTAVDAGEHVAAALSSSDSSPGAQGGETVHVSSADTLGTAVDGGEAVHTGVTSADTLGAMAEAGSVHAALASADTPGTVSDAGEHVAATLSSADFPGAMTETGALVEHVSSADALGAMADGGEFVSDHFSGADTLGTVVTAGEKIALASADTLGTVSTAGEKVRVSGADAFPAMADGGESVGTQVTSADFCQMVDSGFSYISSADTSAMSDLQQVSPQGADTSLMTDAELSNWPGDSDVSTMADAGSWSGTVVDHDTSAMGDGAETVGIADVFPYPGGDSSVMTDTYTPGIGVYTYEPAWVIGPGGEFLVVYRGRVLWRGARAERAGLELAQAVGHGVEFSFAEDSDTVAMRDEDQLTVSVSVVVLPLLEIQLDILLAPEL